MRQRLCCQLQLRCLSLSNTMLVSVARRAMSSTKGGSAGSTNNVNYMLFQFGQRPLAKDAEDDIADSDSPSVARTQPLDHLKKFYLRVHPDLFHSSHQQQQAVNQDNLAKLNSILDFAAQSRCVLSTGCNRALQLRACPVIPSCQICGCCGLDANFTCAVPRAAQAAAALLLPRAGRRSRSRSRGRRSLLCVYSCCICIDDGCDRAEGGRGRLLAERRRRQARRRCRAVARAGVARRQPIRL